MLAISDLLIETLRGLLHTQTTERNNRDKLRADHPDLWTSPSTSARSICLIGCSFSALALHKVHLLSILFPYLHRVGFPSTASVSATRPDARLRLKTTPNRVHPASSCNFKLTSPPPKKNIVTFFGPNFKFNCDVLYYSLHQNSNKNK